MLSISTHGSFSNLEKFLKRSATNNLFKNLDKYGKEGVTALEKATPRDTGKTADSWEYRIVKTRTGFAIEWYNTNNKAGVSIAIAIQYGHATKSGGYVEGRNYINPAVKPLFDRIVSDINREVNG